MRLIDADALADALFNTRKDYPQWVAETIGKMPEAVVRCKDCVFRNAEKDRTGIPWIYCIHHKEYKPEDWYCADGNRRKDGEVE